MELVEAVVRTRALIETVKFAMDKLLATIDTSPIIKDAEEQGNEYGTRVAMGKRPERQHNRDV